MLSLDPGWRKLAELACFDHLVIATLHQLGLPHGKQVCVAHCKRVLLHAHAPVENCTALIICNLPMFYFCDIYIQLEAKSNQLLYINK